MADRTVQEVDAIDYESVTLASVFAGDQYSNAPVTLAFFLNGGAGAVGVTVETPFPKNHLAVDDPQFSIGAGELVVFNATPPELYSDHTGRVNFTYSGTAGNIAATQIALIKVATWK